MGEPYAQQHAPCGCTGLTPKVTFGFPQHRQMERDLAEANFKLRELDQLDAANRTLREEVGGAARCLAPARSCRPVDCVSWTHMRLRYTRSCEACRRGSTRIGSQHQHPCWEDQPAAATFLPYVERCRLLGRLVRLLL